LILRLAEMPKFAQAEFHQSQVEYYAKYSELMYRILRIKRLQFFIESIMNTEDIARDKVREIKVMRLPSFYSRRFKNVGDKRQLFGRYSPKRRLIEIYPLLVWSNQKEPLKSESMDLNKKLGQIGVHAIKTVIWEILRAKYGNERDKVKELTDEYFKLYEKTFVKS